MVWWWCGDGGAVGIMLSLKSLKKTNGWKEIIKKILKNFILIKIEFFDVGDIVKWDGISNKVAFWNCKIE